MTDGSAGALGNDQPNPVAAGGRSRASVIRTSPEVAFATFPLTAPDVAGDSAVFLKDNRGMRRVFLRDIFYLEADGNYVELHLRNGRVVLRNSMSEVLRALPADVFYMVNRAQAVNILLVDHIGSDEVGIGKFGFTLSRRYRDELVSRLPVISGR
jgi:DNA-binding LytR/AlgR family response regulator